MRAMFKRLRKLRYLMMSPIMPYVPASILGDVGRILDKVFGICIILLIIILILIIAWILSHFMGGGGRG